MGCPIQHLTAPARLSSLVNVIARGFAACAPLPLPPPDRAADPRAPTRAESRVLRHLASAAMILGTRVKWDLIPMPYFPAGSTNFIGKGM